MTERIRIAFLGSHPRPFGTRGFLQNINERYEPIEGIELVALADVNEESAQASKELFGFQRCYTDYREMLAREKLDAAVILLPTFLHKQASIDCLEAGLHILCEKPPANDYEEMVAIADAVKKSGKHYMFIRQSRFGPNAIATRKMITNGELGSIYAGESRWVRTRSAQVTNASWRSEKGKGGGVLLDLGIHGIDLAWYCMGNPKPLEVSGSDIAAFQEYSKNPEQYTADDNFLSWIRFDNGAVLEGMYAFGMNHVGPPNPKHDSDLPYSKEWQTCKLFGTRGGVDIFEGKLIHGDAESFTVDAIPVTQKSEPPMVAQARHFVQSILDDTQPLNSIEHALTLMQMLTALRQSADQNQSIRLT